jgi:hypothetical protein
MVCLGVRRQSVSHSLRVGLRFWLTVRPNGADHEYDKSMVVLKLRGARQRMKAKTGEQCEGRKPYGHYKDKGEDIALERMKALRAEGMGFDRIAEELNAEGLKPRTGERWWGKTVNNILSAQSA